MPTLPINCFRPVSQLLFYLLIKPLSYLPLRALYLLSDGLYGLLYHVIGYRKAVVRSNLAGAFPQRSEAERRKIERAFYRHLCDLMVEAIRLFSISERDILRRCHIRNPELLTPYAAQGRSVIVAAAHYNNWELNGAASDRQISHQAVGAYTAIKDPFFSRVLTDSRSRFGLRMVPVREIQAFFAQPGQPPFAMLFAGDQSPRKPERAYWTTFLGRDTGVMWGTERYAKQYNLPVFYGRMIKVRRGCYEAEFELITDTPRATAEGEITEAHTRLLEADIRQAPQFWLWSHKRWKHKKPETRQV